MIMIHFVKIFICISSKNICYIRIYERYSFIYYVCADCTIIIKVKRF